MDTLSYHKQRPLRAYMNLTDASLVHVMGEYGNAKKMLKEYEGKVLAKPEEEALWFYLQIHIMMLISKSVDNDEPLGEYKHFVDAYHKDINCKVIRMFYYIMLICSRESRHMHSGPGREELWKKYPHIYDYHKKYVQDSSDVEAVNALMSNAPDITLGEYTQFLVDAFELPSYDSAFGGEKWKAVAEPLRDFVHGTISAEMLMDVAFTLAHNGGPIFNKGMLYTSFSSSNLNRILDIQRSGQIPQAILHSISTPDVQPQMEEYVQAFIKLSKESFGTVDWKRVKNIKGKAVYTSEISQQNNAENGIDTISEMKVKVAGIKQAKEQKEFKNSNVEIMSGVYVKKSERSLS